MARPALSAVTEPLKPIVGFADLGRLLQGDRGSVPRSLALPLLCSVSAQGITSLNDFKRVEGDRQMGIASLPEQLGVAVAARTACWVMGVPQLGVVAMLLASQQPGHALAVVGLIGLQLLWMRRFLQQPTARAIGYGGFGVPLLLAWMRKSAFASRSAS